jgi:hypothetical protein
MPHRLMRPLLWAAGALAAFYVAVSWTGWHRQAAEAAGVGARIVCSCRHVEGRDLASCAEDLRGMPWMAVVRYVDDPKARRVTASVPLMAARSARLKDGFGCLPERD